VIGSFANVVGKEKLRKAKQISFLCYDELNFIEERV
jgi:hypothetical protein